MTRKKVTQKDAFGELRRFDGTLMVVDDELRKIQKDLTEHDVLTMDDERRLIGFSEQLDQLVVRARSTQRTIDGFRKTHKFTS